MAKKKFKVLSHLWHDGKEYKPESVVEMDEAEAAQIPKVVEPLTDKPAEPAKK